MVKASLSALSANKKLIFVSAVVMALVAADQAAKAIIRATVSESESISLFGSGIIQVVHVTNTGSLFGLLKGTAPYLVALSAALAVAIIIVFSKLGKLHKVAAVLILSGLIGNTIDRIAFRTVTDFIYVKPWPAFNLADAMLATGAALIAVSIAASAVIRKKAK